MAIAVTDPVRGGGDGGRRVACRRRRVIVGVAEVEAEANRDRRRRRLLHRHRLLRLGEIIAIILLNIIAAAASIAADEPDAVIVGVILDREAA